MPDRAIGGIVSAVVHDRFGGKFWPIPVRFSYRFRPVPVRFGGEYQPVPVRFSYRFRPIPGS